VIDSRGVALVVTLLLLFLMSVLGLAAVLSTSSDLMINGYYANFRASFYAADSGLNVARQTMLTNLNPGTMSWSPTWTSCASGTSLGPLTSTMGTTVASQVTQNYGASSPLTGSGVATPGAAANSLSESFKITSASITLPSTSPTVTCPSGSPTAFQYIYNYSITSVGSATGLEQSTVTENGSIMVHVTLTPATWSPSFAYFGAFINNYAPCLGALIPGTMTGPMFTNGAWGFETGGSYIFTDPVGQVQADASYFVGGTCYQAAASTYTHNGQTVAPQFQDGFNLSQNSIPQPPNDFSQKWAALDAMGCGENNGSVCTNPASPAPLAPTAAQMNADLKTVTGTAYPTGGATTGVYLNYQSVSGVQTIAGGGLYVEGNAQVSLSTSGSSAQVITITQGGTTTTMTVDPVANTTVVQSGSTILSLAGVPKNLALTPPQTGTMVYVDGNITSMSGPGQGVPAVQDGAALTITALGNVNITGDIIYKTEPVTTTQNQIPNTSVDTLIPGNDKNQDLGIFTANGNINLSSPYSNQNLEVDGSLATVGQNCPSNSCGFTVSGHINTFNNVGGQIQTNIFGADMNTENTYYDRRYNTRAGFAPPWFPGTTITNTSPPTTGPPQMTTQRTQWVASPGQ
jgi:Tfp pilus assembly protein PilX